MKDYDYEIHPIAELFPIIPASEIKELAGDIKAHGLIHPITVYECKILDGRHRYAACLTAGVKPRFVELPVGDDPVAFVISANLHRRHLTTSQRAMIAANLADMKRGGDRKSEDFERSRPASENLRLQLDKAAEMKTDNRRFDHAQAAEIMAVSPRSVDRASKVKDASPSLAKQVVDGELTVHGAAKKIDAKKAANEPVFDDIGTRIPYHAIPYWKRRQEIQDMLTSLSRIKSTVERAKKEGDCMFGKVSNSTIDSLSSAYTHLLEAKPYAVCTACEGHFEVQPKGCSFCGNKGLISKWQWDVQAPKELKDLRLKANSKVGNVP